MAVEGDENYLTTAEVARRLQVKPETIYAYVSRGMLTSIRARGRRGSLFAASEVERLASKSIEHSGVVERIESELTLLEADELYYRGFSVRSLATTATVEQVAHLLWTGRPPEPTAPEHPTATPTPSRNHTGVPQAAARAGAGQPGAGHAGAARVGQAGAAPAGQAGAAQAGQAGQAGAAQVGAGQVGSEAGIAGTFGVRREAVDLARAAMG